MARPTIAPDPPDDAPPAWSPPRLGIHPADTARNGDAFGTDAFASASLAS